MNQSLKGLFLGAALATSVIVGVVGATAASEGDIAYRKAVMEAIGGHIKASAAIVKGQVPHGEHLKGHAHALAELAKISESIFPKGSGEGKTGAKAEIWDNPEDFKKVVTGFETATAAFAKASESGDMKTAAAAFGDVANSCKACHSKYRAK